MLKGKSVAATTLGCKVNQAETDSMLDMLSAAGADIVDFEEKADIYIVNTCSVTNIADKKSRQMLHRAKKRNPESIVIAAGCYVQSAKELLEQDESVDIVISNNKKKDITDIVNDYINVRKNEGGDTPAGGEKKEYFIDISKETEYEEMGGHVPVGHTRAYVKIQDGCNQFCSYCIIPYVRGRIRSRSEEAVIAEVTELAESGIKEVVLTGIHISSYGKDKNNEGALIDLIDAISKIKGIKRIRLGSLEPGIITEDFVRRVSANKKVCPHFHLSLQSGCNTILKRMNRKYTREQYFEKCEMLREAYDAPALTTDVIVGFPGETDEEFEETVQYLTELNLYEMHIFKYSPRKGTVAAAMKDQVSPEVKNKRSDVLLELAERGKKAYEAKYEGAELEVLVEEVLHREDGTYLRGHTERYMDILIKAGDIPMPESFVNSFVYVRYTQNGDILMV
ncbi:tRNA (N(6)-L-threonylcarbamoyladenosine(37)-C(2))-methylthiotransferase MtaB [Coprococcus eutactus]|jgi:threonylcarbamoyladenosine tRNA methylthiotransferase MtaB|uniref:tRNA (N(6)-L-threonylcarbamoyladenosine(37)-C(2))- methylthiotransferase MtaB n=1 Tax=Coprococcus eutactus TaxID=33043 RepID=UPI00015EA16D|nr:tRNA (N(6)-L-threonylcarbamoyladenosine(37)-C(2))-methylthiotransferase MtaB [Coprococcus eutactus]EDP25002.1 tRNA methylthiotransferase YqeV [Coprococcus eutactus ATCC 27759]UEA80165.1 tRNA (N(6)-L-threonylcarbamoyladenosine(37)-C(2))-methylthiotransferase MtaB [Coprococcus eutactus ATCC 27759]UWP17959.1 tRNA (N(6)-L-threonylcarbamoyladenosine(37)-C(2))-methylthiotransferase MtaB [Coprococcus eutactus]